MEHDLLSLGLLTHLIRPVEFHAMRVKLSVWLTEGHVCTFVFFFFFSKKNLAYSSQIVLQTISDSFAPQEVIPYDIPLQRVWTSLPVLLSRLYMLVVQENSELLDARRITFASL